MLRVLCDENVPRSLVVALRAFGHDVQWVAETIPGASDATVLGRAAEDGRICLTFDKDFGELAARNPETAEAGVILLRLPSWPPEVAANRIATVIDARRDWAGHFSVIEPGRLRMRPVEPSG